MGEENKTYEIVVSGVTKRFEKKEGSFLALDEVNLKIDKNEFICVVGPSGCGKTTLMNIIAGLYPPSTGTVKVRGEVVTGPGKGKGVVFQQYALYPWLTVEKNVAFGLKMKGVGNSVLLLQEHMQQNLKYYLWMNHSELLMHRHVPSYRQSC